MKTFLSFCLYAFIFLVLIIGCLLYIRYGKDQKFKEYMKKDAIPFCVVVCVVYVICAIISVIFNFVSGW